MPKKQKEKRVVISGEKFEKSKTYQRIVSGKLTWHCEWCGQEMMQGDITDAKEMLEQVRKHSLGCIHNPRFNDSGKVDNKEIAKGSLGRYCEWCGEEEIDKNILGSRKKLKQARHHSLNCKCNPLVNC